MNRPIRYFLAPLLMLASAAIVSANPEVPGAPQAKPIALVNGTIHPISGPAIARGVLVFDGGKITALGAAVKPPAGAEVIDLAGKHVYPALFDAHSDIGLVEVNSVRATVDSREVGAINPNVRAIVAVNPDSELIPVARSNGLLLALAAPRGQLLAGRSAVIQLDGWTWEEMALKSEVGLHLEWPRGRTTPLAPGDEPPPAGPPAEDRISTLRKAFADARAYLAARKADENYPRDARWEALADAISGKLPLLVHADTLDQIQAAVAFIDEQKCRMILVGGYDAPQCAELLKARKIPVIVFGVYRNPLRRGDDYDACYTLPERLRQAGLKFCIACDGRHGASQARNLPYHAATASAYGLPHDDALRAITLSPAEILGVADRVGSLEVGKDATLFIADGDPLETATQVSAAYVQGRSVSLVDRHKRLYQKYQQKYLQAGGK